VAFESFRGQHDQRRARRRRRLAFVLVAVFHGVLIAAGVVYSYWHVDELTPPTLRVTFMSAAPPPPPPPPPPAAGGGSRPKKVALKPKTPEPVVTKPPEIVQPPEKPRPIKKEFRKHEDEYVEEDNAKPATGAGKGKGSIGDGDEDGEEGGVKGGQKGGVIGGSIGGAGTTPAPKIVPPNVGEGHRQGCAKPDFPASLRKAGISYFVNAKICVTGAGTVDTISILNHEDSLLEQSITRSEKACRYSPWIIGNVPAPFCYVEHFEFRGE